MLTQKQKEMLKQMLLDELAELEERERNSQKELETISSAEGSEGDEADQAAFIEHRNRLLRLLDRDHKMSNKIVATLKKFQDDTYGICESCGLDISYERLLSRPVASLCIECKQKQEERELRDKQLRRR